MPKIAAFFPKNACANWELTGSGGLQTAGRGAPRLAIERHLDAQNQKGRDFVASGGLETAPPSYRTRQLSLALILHAPISALYFQTSVILISNLNLNLNLQS